MDNAIVANLLAHKVDHSFARFREGRLSLTEPERARGASRSRTCTEMTDYSPYKRRQEPFFVPDFKACPCDCNVISTLFLERPESIRRISSVPFFYVVYHLLTVRSFFRRVTRDI